MPVFYFPVWEHGKLIPDEEGVELPDSEEARVEALRTLSEIARDALPSSPNGLRLRMVVIDEAGARLFELRLEADVSRVQPQL
jgi:hypothetical protein